MSMGYGAGYADVVTELFVQEQCCKEFDKFKSLVSDMGAFAQLCMIDEQDSSEEHPNVIRAYNALCMAFKRKTGLLLSLGYHNSDDEGSCYDDVDGIYWAVSGVYKLTPAGKKYRKAIERKFFVTFG